MKVLALGGSGGMGRYAVQYLHNIKQIEKIYVAGVNSLSAKKFASHFDNRVVGLKLDIRELDIKHLDGVNSIIHLANIANDPAVILNPTLSWEVNVLASKQIADSAIKAKVKQIIYASSGSVYGIKDEKKVTKKELKK